jgi:hypothetical protein
MLFREGTTDQGNRLSLRGVAVEGVGVLMLAAACGDPPTVNVVPDAKATCPGDVTTYVLEPDEVPDHAANEIVAELDGGNADALSKAIIDGLDGQPGIIEVCQDTDGTLIAEFPGAATPQS